MDSLSSALQVIVWSQDGSAIFKSLEIIVSMSAVPAGMWMESGIAYISLSFYLNKTEHAFQFYAAG